MSEPRTVGTRLGDRFWSTLVRTRLTQATFITCQRGMQTICTSKPQVQQCNGYTSSNSISRSTASRSPASTAPTTATAIPAAAKARHPALPITGIESVLNTTYWRQ